jgi:hypothetical protein
MLSLVIEIVNLTPEGFVIAPEPKGWAEQVQSPKTSMNIGASIFLIIIFL